ncbi:GNAT family N-acetyltransferase [Granulicella sp. WH15]|uniref:GNAT family N-acetyltransferase n=1 Tax=Granulicella sp. WH15 TaxID=2602070 RepID=UPI001366EDA1|nr:GNAT family N-acyltransferase [Granulicella sp. WH15]QHN04605.1 GNAT family N-acetyltransferase [Granulicella sp. WH15]
MPATARSFDVQPVDALPVDVLHDLRADVRELPTRRTVWLEAGAYVARLAISEADRLAAYRLRFLVFNLEMNEGLESAYEDGYDTDRYDSVCEQLIVEHRATGAIVGTYRLQMGDVAARHFGYYSEQEFDFTPYESMRSQIVELGRACIHREHRSSDVLNLLWRGIARYVIANGGRYMMGCCSLPSLDPKLGHAIFRSLKSYMVEPSLVTVPTAAYALPEGLPDATVEGSGEEVRAPRLLRAYLAIGAKICSQPAIDWEFKTIDFLTLCDLQALHPRVAARFLSGC